MKKHYSIQAKKPVSKFLNKQDENTRNRMISAMELLQEFPPQGDIEPITGKKGWYRQRMGKYRILFTIDHVKELVVIHTIDGRGDIYK